MTEREPKYVVGSRPVNRRTAARARLQLPKVAAVAIERVKAAQARNRLGAPLADRLRVTAARRGAPLRASTVAGGIVAACGGLGLFFALLHMSALAGMAGLGGLAGGLLLARSGRGAASASADVAQAPLFDPEAVDAFDRALQQLATELPAEVVQPLAAFKQVVVRMGRQPGAATADEHFLVEDRLYANECLRRYLPDTLQAYLAVPREQRAVPLADGQTPQALLLQQVALLHAELEKREAKLARSAAEALLRQQRFLDAKRG